MTPDLRTTSIGLALLTALMVFSAVMTAITRPAPAPTNERMVINTRSWSCVTVQLDGRWQWPPICEPIASTRP